MQRLAFWKGRRVFVTGHTGFKGGWLSTWLIDAGAELTGYALAPDTIPNFFKVCGLDGRMRSIVADVRNAESLQHHLTHAQPEVVFHLAAQPLVRRSLRLPAETLMTNVMGTAYLLDAVRSTPSVRAVVVVTSDKCYDSERGHAVFRETDALGGNDPYSASKAGAEIVTHAYERSFFDASEVGVATARAGNVFGGGDWAADRLIPDAVRAVTSGHPLRLRNPEAVRPWQHVLEPLGGYLRLAERLIESPEGARGAWNFGPPNDAAVSVGALANLFHAAWGSGAWEHIADPIARLETPVLRLNSDKARRELGWSSRLSLESAMARTALWYRQASRGDADAAFALSCDQIHDYEAADRHSPV